MSKAAMKDQRKRQLHYSVEQIFLLSKGAEINYQVHLRNHSSFWYSARFLTVELLQREGFHKCEFLQSHSREERINTKAKKKKKIEKKSWDTYTLHLESE